MAVVLIADDDPDIRDLVEFKLTQVGHAVVAREDGPAALEAIRANRPDIALLDVMMPGMTGIEVCRALRTESATADLPVILLTARASDSDMEEGIEVGADDYVIKPFSLRDLTNRVEELLAEGRT
jgi:DNA-binding response OmpR family regulator